MSNGYNAAARSVLDVSGLDGTRASIPVPRAATWFRRFLAFAGPGYLVSVGYMDPGNWATDIAGGSAFGYPLLFVILLSNAMAVLLQALAARVGIVTGRDLAQLCRDAFPRPVSLALWVACELAIVACDLAEVIGTAIALNLLFGIPIIGGALLTALDAILLLALMRRGFRFLESFVGALLIVIFACFAAQIVAAAPPVAALIDGLFVPSARIVTDPSMLYAAIGIVGATVMPHNLYLHSSIVQTRAFERTDAGRREAIGWASLDSTVALTLALFVNAAILIVATVAFHDTGHTQVTELGEAFAGLAPLLGFGAASLLFGGALLASGLNATVTGTLAGQIVMEGFLNLRLPPWGRRLLTRGVAVVPVVVAAAVAGDRGTAELLVFSQVVLSMQLPFAVIPLILFATDRRRMGRFALSRPAAALSWAVAGLIVVLNVVLLAEMIGGMA